MGPFHYLAGLLLCGLVMGIVFDLYNTITGSSKWLRWLRPILDLSFWILSALVVFYISFVTDDGRFRVYTFGLLLIGYGVYRLTLHHKVVGSAFLFVRFVTSIVQFIYNIVYVVVFRPIFLIFKVIWVILTHIYRLLCVLENALFWMIRFGIRVFSWPVKNHLVRLKKHPKISQRWEGMWELVAKWIKKNPERT